MSCLQTCKNRTLLLAGEEKLAKLNQTKSWLKELVRQEPQRRTEVIKKTEIVNTMIITTMAESGLLVNKIARGCQVCSRLTN